MENRDFIKLDGHFVFIDRDELEFCKVKSYSEKELIALKLGGYYVGSSNRFNAYFSPIQHIQYYTRPIAYNTEKFKFEIFPFCKNIDYKTDIKKATRLDYENFALETFVKTQEIRERYKKYAPRNDPDLLRITEFDINNYYSFEKNRDGERYDLLEEKYPPDSLEQTLCDIESSFSDLYSEMIQKLIHKIKESIKK